MIGRGVGGYGGLLVEHCLGTRTRADLAPQHRALIERDAKEQGAQVAAWLVARQHAMQRQEGILAHVLGEIRFPQVLRGETQDSRLVTANEGSERRRDAAAGEQSELVIVALVQGYGSCGRRRHELELWMAGRHCGLDTMPDLDCNRVTSRQCVGR